MSNDSLSTYLQDNSTSSSAVNGSHTTPLGILAHLHMSVSVFIFLIILAAITLSIGISVAIYMIRQRLGYSDKPPKKYKLVEEDNIFIDDSDKHESKYGYLDLSIFYDKRKMRLVIRDIHANNILSSKPQSPDCFVKMFLKNVRKKNTQLKRTRTVMDDNSPMFSETFNFNIANIHDTVVGFEVIDDNPNGNDILLGEGTLYMSKQPMDAYTGVVQQTYVILECPQKIFGKGDVCVIINATTNVTLVILEARNIMCKYARVLMNHTMHPDIFVTVTVSVDNRRKKKFTTKKVHNTDCPYFLETFHLGLRPGDLKSTCVKIVVLETDSMRMTRKIGRIYIGNPRVNKQINAMGKMHWDEICSGRSQSKAMWHSIS